MADVGVGFVDILPRTDKFVSTLSGQMNKAFSSVGTQTSSTSKLVSGLQYSFIALGAVAVASIGKAVNATVEWSREVLTLQRVTGQSAESASALLAVMGEFGLSAQQATVGLGIFDKNIVNNSANLLKYGIATKDAQGNLLPFDTILGNAADKFVGLGNAQEQAAFAMNIFGRSGKALIPILKQGSAGIDELKQAAAATGLVIGQDTVNAAIALGVQQRTLNESFKGLAVTIGTTFLPIVTDLTRIMTEFVQLLVKVPAPVYEVVLGFTALAGIGAAVIKVGTGIAAAWGSVFAALASVGTTEAVVVDPTVALTAAVAALTESLGAQTAVTGTATEGLVGYGVTESGLLAPTAALTQANLDLAASEEAAGAGAAGTAAAGGGLLGWLAGIGAAAKGALVPLAEFYAAYKLLGAPGVAPVSDMQAFNVALGDLITAQQGLQAARSGDTSIAGVLTVSQWKAQVAAARSEAVALGGVGAALDLAARKGISYDEALQRVSKTSQTFGGALKNAFAGITPTQLLGEVTNGVELLGTSLFHAQTRLQSFAKFSGTDVQTIIGSIAKVATDPTKTIQATLDAYAAGIAQLRQANQQWHDSIVQAFGGAGSALDKFANKSKFDFANAIASLQKYTGQIKSFGSDVATIQDRFGKKANDFINWASQQGLAQAGLVDKVANSNKKMGDSFITQFNKAGQATGTLASQIQKALDPVFNHIVAELVNISRVMQGLPSLKIKADTSEAHAAVTSFVNSIPRDIFVTVHAQNLRAATKGASGGYVTPDGIRHLAAGGSTDTIPAMLSPGEFVFRRSAVDRIGIAALQQMNQGGQPEVGPSWVQRRPQQLDGALRIMDWRNGLTALDGELAWEDTVRTR